MEPVYIWWGPSASVHQQRPIPTPAYLSRCTYAFTYMELQPRYLRKTIKEASSASEVPLHYPPADYIWFLEPTLSSGVLLNGWPRLGVLLPIKSFYEVIVCKVAECAEWGFGGSVPRAVEADSVLHTQLEWFTFWDCLCVILLMFSFHSLSRRTSLVDLFIADFFLSIDCSDVCSVCDIPSQSHSSLRLLILVLYHRLDCYITLSLLLEGSSAVDWRDDQHRGFAYSDFDGRPLRNRKGVLQLPGKTEVRAGFDIETMTSLRNALMDWNMKGKRKPCGTYLLDYRLNTCFLKPWSIPLNLDKN